MEIPLDQDTEQLTKSNPDLEKQETSKPRVLDLQEAIASRSFGRTKPLLFQHNEPRLTIGPHCKPLNKGPFFLCLFSLTLVLGYIFIQFISQQVDFWVKSLGAGLLAVQLSSYCYTAFANPGIPEIRNFELVDSKQVEIKRCRECFNYIRMDRSTRHCYDCKVCVEGRLFNLGYDHHCPWTSKCIGRKTIRSFYVFVSFTMVLFVYFIFTVSYVGNMNNLH